MARTLGNVSTNDLVDNSHKVLGIAINTSSNTGGPFATNFTTLKQAKSNLINLILTKKGERVAQPEFGCDIWKLLFEPIIEGELDRRVESTIIEAVSIWLPYLNIDEIIFDYDENDIDNNTIVLEVKFSLASNPNMSDTITLNVSNN
jgi:phage baseplate assembly protein W